MRRVRLNETGWDLDLITETVEVPATEPEGDQVDIDVEACGVCYRDCIDRDGGFAFMQIPVTPGHEVVGRVVAIGPEASDWTIGDRVGSMHRDFCGVCKACIDGGYATRMRGPQRLFFVVPEALSAEEAAVMHCTFGTSLRGLRRSGGVGPGDHVVVTGASGGVGTAGVQVASHLGATVTAVTRDEGHRAFLTDLGADNVIVDPGTGFHKQLLDDRADVVLECVGPPTFNSSLRSLRMGGAMVVIGNIVAEKVALNLGYLVTNGVRLIGSSGATRADMASLFQMHSADPFRVQVHEALDLGEADNAQRRLRSGGLRGRLVLLPGTSDT